MSKKISFFTLIFVPLLSFGQMQINSFDSEPADSTYWGYEISENADSTKSFVNISYSIMLVNHFLRIQLVVEELDQV